MGNHLVKESEDHWEVLSDKEYQQRQSRKGCFAALFIIALFCYGYYSQEDEEPDKTKTEVVSEKSQSVETEQLIEPRVVIKDENPAISYENVEGKTEQNIEQNVEEKVEKNKDENVEEEVPSRKEEKSISIDALVKSTQNNQDE